MKKIKCVFNDLTGKNNLDETEIMFLSPKERIR